MDNKLSMDEQGVAVAKKVSRLLGCTSEGITSRDKEVITLCSELVQPHPEYCLQFWSPLCKTDVENLERVQRGATKMIKGLETAV